MLFETLCNPLEILTLWGRKGENILSVFCPDSSSHLGLPGFLNSISWTQWVDRVLCAWFPFSTLQPQNSLKGINWDRQLIGLTSFYSSLSDDCPYCLMSNVSQTIVSNCFVHYLIVSGRRVNPVSFILSWLEAGVPTWYLLKYKIFFKLY